MLAEPTPQAAARCVAARCSRSLLPPPQARLEALRAAVPPSDMFFTEHDKVFGREESYGVFDEARGVCLL